MSNYVLLGLLAICWLLPLAVTLSTYFAVESGRGPELSTQIVTIAAMMVAIGLFVGVGAYGAGQFGGPGYLVLYWVFGAIAALIAVGLMMDVYEVGS